jgi:hypothetical protein
VQFTSYFISSLPFRYLLSGIQNRRNVHPKNDRLRKRCFILEDVKAKDSMNACKKKQQECKQQQERHQQQVRQQQLGHHQQYQPQQGCQQK